MRRSLLILAALALTAGFLPAQTTGQKAVERPDRFPLRAIEIRGNEHFSSGDIIALSGLKIGETVEPKDFERALEKINSAGVFDGLEFRYEPHEDGYRVVYTVDEVSDLYKVRFRGFGVPEEEIHARLEEKIPLFGPQVPPTGPMINRIGDNLQEFWESLGNDTKVDGRLLSAGEDEFEMVFQPRGTIQTIALTKFTNAQVISNLDLQREFFTVGNGVPYSEERLLELLDYNIRPLYEEKGRLEVEFCPCTTEPDPDTKGLIVTVEVDEGPEYTFGEVRLPELKEFGEEKITEAVKFESGDRAEFNLVNETVAAIDTLFKANGYMNATVDYDRKLHPDSKTVDVAILANPGDRYTFNKLTLKGLDLIGEAAVRKRWGLDVGDPFNASYPAFFLSTIVAEGMFDNLDDTGWSLQVNEARKTVDVELTFH